MPDLAPLRPGDPQRVREYRLTGRLGEGGQGTVYLGVSPTGARVAVKLLRPGLTRDGRRWSASSARSAWPSGSHPSAPPR